MGLIASLLLGPAQELGSETLVMTATYPSPVGIYARIITTGGAGNLDTILSRNNSNVGIGTGTTAPAGKLDVRGPGNVIFYTSGSVGIGTASPAYKLDVRGDVGWPGYSLLAGTVPWARIPASSCGGPGQYAYATNGGGLVCGTLPGPPYTINTMTGPNFTINSGGGGIVISNNPATNTVTISNTAAAGVAGSGSANYAAKWTSSSSLGTGSIYDNGYVGIGTTSPAEMLDVAGKVHASGMKAGDLTSANNTISAFNGLDVFVSGVGIGGVGIGRNTAGSIGLGIARGSTPVGSFYSINDDSYVGVDTYGGRHLYLNSSGNLALNAGGSWRLYINGSSGFVGIGTSFPQDELDVANNISFGGCARNEAHSVTYAGSCTSDERLKKDIRPVTGALEKLLRLEPVSFEFKDSKHGQGRQEGLLAQKVEQVFPEWVATGPDGYKRVAYGTVQFQMLLLEAVKEQQAQIRSLRAQMRGLGREEE